MLLLKLAIFSCATFNNIVQFDSLKAKGQKEVMEAVLVPEFFEPINKCGTQQYMEAIYKADPPALLRKQILQQKIEKYILDNVAEKKPEIQSFRQNIDQKNVKVTIPNTIIIPVVVNVIYNTVAENISCEQIVSQIDALNRDFKSLTIPANLPSAFAPYFGNMNIQFRLMKIRRKWTYKTVWGNNSYMKKSKTSPTDTNYDGIAGFYQNKYLNIWVCNLGPGQYGFANYSILSPAFKWMDGVVVSPYCFGTIGVVVPPQNLGKTTTHEIGHWLNLIHIWGDSNCGNDLVNDTPNQFGPNRGSQFTFPHQISANCPPNLINLPQSDMYMNYMDYTDDSVQNMFSKEQVIRSRILFEKGFPRAKFKTKRIGITCNNSIKIVN